MQFRATLFGHEPPEPRDPIDQRLVYQRLRAIEAGFGDPSVRHALSADTLEPLRRVYNRYDEETGQGGFAGRIKTLLAQRLLPFARLFAVASEAQSTRFQPPQGFAVDRNIVDDDVARELLSDHHAGWRFIGLARAASDPSVALLDGLFDSIGFEAVWELHLEWFFRAIAALLEREPTLGLTHAQLVRLEQLAPQARGDLSSRILGRLQQRQRTSFAYDVFVSYVAADEKPPLRRDGWVNTFVRRLEGRLGELLGRSARVWTGTGRDFSGEVPISERWEDVIRTSALMLCVLSPDYLSSPWIKRELDAFNDTLSAQPLVVSSPRRIFQVMKSRIEPDQMRWGSHWQSSSFDFSEAEIGRPLQTAVYGDQQAERYVREKINDLARSMAASLKALEKPGA